MIDPLLAHDVMRTRQLRIHLWSSGLLVRPDLNDPLVPWVVIVKCRRIGNAEIQLRVEKLQNGNCAAADRRCKFVNFRNCEFLLATKPTVNDSQTVLAAYVNSAFRWPLIGQLWHMCIFAPSHYETVASEAHVFNRIKPINVL